MDSLILHNGNKANIYLYTNNDGSYVNKIYHHEYQQYYLNEQQILIKLKDNPNIIKLLDDSNENINITYEEVKIFQEEDENENGNIKSNIEEDIEYDTDYEEENEDPKETLKKLLIKSKH